MSARTPREMPRELGREMPRELGREMRRAPRRAAAAPPPDRREQLAVNAEPHEHPIHTSLVRSVLTLGVERHVLALEATLVLALVLGAGVTTLTLVLGAGIAFALHPVLVWVTTRDPLATAVALRSRGYADYYAPQAAVHRSPPRPHPSVPDPR